MSCRKRREQMRFQAAHEKWMEGSWETEKSRGICLPRSNPVLEVR